MPRLSLYLASSFPFLLRWITKNTQSYSFYYVQSSFYQSALNKRKILAKVSFQNTMKHSLSLIRVKIILKCYLLKNRCDVIPRESTSVKLDKQAKIQAQGIFKDLGLTMGDAFNLFLHQVNLNHGLPFEVKIPNAETKQAILDARKGKNVVNFSLDEFK